jgi:hypothetical protein
VGKVDGNFEGVSEEEGGTELIGLTCFSTKGLPKRLFTALTS